MQTQSFTGLDVRALRARGVGGNIARCREGSQHLADKKNIFASETKGYLPQPVEEPWNRARGVATLARGAKLCERNATRGVGHHRQGRTTKNHETLPNP